MKEHHVCPASNAWQLDNPFRKLVHNPKKLLAPYVRPGMTVLDVGAASGFFARALAELVGNGTVIAADVQEDMLNKLKDSIRGKPIEKRIVIHKTKPDSLDLKTKVDFILLFYVLHELPNKKRFFTEAKTLLKKGGKVLIVEPKGHVKKEEFNSFINEAKGFTIEKMPKIRFSRAVLLQL